MVGVGFLDLNKKRVTIFISESKTEFFHNSQSATFCLFLRGKNYRSTPFGMQVQRSTNGAQQY